MISILKKFPFAVVTSLAWVFCKYCGVDTSMTTTWGTVILILSFATAVTEFLKSGDIGEWRFFFDQLFGYFQVIICAVGITLILVGKIPGGVTLPDVVFCIAITFDVLFSPCNSFGRALRSVAPTGHHDH